MKKTIITLMCLLLLSGVGLASPLTDYSAGKVSLDLDVYPNLDIKYSISTSDFDTTGKSDNYSVGLTAGLGKKFALQYRTFTPENERQASVANCRTEMQEFNLLYKVSDNVSVFAGNNRVKWKNMMGGIDYPAKNIFQGGLILSSKIDKKVTLFGVAGFGSDLKNYEIGIGYAVSPKLELNVTYRDLQTTVHTFKNGDKFDSKVTGIGYGLTYKF